MTSWYSNILTRTTSQISNLRSTLLSSEADGDTEDDTHVCRVLRNYYTDKGRPLPSWLPPDPKAAAPVPQPLYSQPQVGARYGGLGAQNTGGSGGLSSLWDSGPSQPQQQQPGSLRAGRPGGMPQRGSGMSLGGPGREDVQARPLPSQRAGSYQSAMGSQQQQSQPSAGAGGAASAQDRLKQKLWGSARQPSPSQGGSQFQPPAANSSGGGGDSYEDHFAPGGAYGPPSGGQRRPGLPSGPRAYR